MSDSPPAFLHLSRPVLGILVISGLVLFLQLPIAMIRDVIADRVETRNEAVAEITGSWGGQQYLVGPRLVVPYRASPLERAPSLSEDSPESERVEGYATFLPASLTIDGQLATEALSRGLFTVPVFNARVALRGVFEVPDAGGLGIAESDLLWGRATLVIEVSDAKSVGGGSSVVWGGDSVALLPGAGAAARGRSGVHSQVAAPTEGPEEFHIELELKGSQGLWFAPFSRSTHVALRSNWNSPSFGGAWLPTERTVENSGFSAAWDVPFLGRDYPQQWTSPDEPHDQILTSRFGVELISPVDPYRMSERSTKYAALFLALTFGLLWLFDTLAGVRIHPVQYLLVGGAMCLFYLLELSLGEILGFAPAYLVAALSVAVLVGSYGAAVLDSTRRGSVVVGALGLLYAYLLLLLALERYSLLVGSLGLFALLGAIMYLTRGVDWHRDVADAEA